MKTLIVSLLVGIGILPVLTESGSAARPGVRKIPLDTVYTTTRQKDTKSALPGIKGFGPPSGKTIAGGKPTIFLVNGKDFPAAVKASQQVLWPKGRDWKPGTKTETRAGEQNWVFAYLGSFGSSPPAYRVLSVAIDGSKVRITYEDIKKNWSSLDFYSYFAWAPLGKLAPGEYTLELYETKAGKTMATAKARVIKE